MAIRNNMNKGFIMSAFNSTEFGQVGAILSPEDVAWADSCLTRDIEVLDSDWNSMRDALLETLSDQHETSDTEMEISHYIEEIQGMHDEVKSDIRTAINDRVAARSSGNKMTHPRTNGFWSEYCIEDVLVPSYYNNLRELGISEDIFRIWDLGIPPELDNFVKQLNGALAECSLEPTPSVSDHSVAGRGSNGESLGDLVSGMTNLSLGPNFG